MIKKNLKKYSLKIILDCLRFHKRNRQIVKNNIFEISFDENRVNVLRVPNIQNKAFKVSKWFVKVGTYIEKNQVICELESNSITVEFESLTSGKVVAITRPKEKLFPDDTICKIELI